MDIQVGDQAIDYAQVAQKEKLSDLQLRIRQLVEQVEQITKEQSYQRVNIFFKNKIFYLFYLRHLLSIYYILELEFEYSVNASNRFSNF